MTINVKIIHPTNNSDIDVGLPENILLSDVFSQLIDANFLSAGQPYTGVLKPSGIRKESVALDNNKTVAENGIGNNDTIQTLIATQAGGGFGYVADLWQSFYPYLDQIGTVVTVVGASFGFGMWVKGKFEKKYTPRQFTDIITNKELWNSHELAMILDITDEESKNLLKGYGYKWDKRYSLYYKTDTTVEIMEKIKNSNH